ncbi:MAG: hypothetical protein ABJF07_18930, partial [Nisaea sp.]|uniref:hypothetical protein n=1 Tax=Nisaea sp. TaxID=2024842 RepID=UPI0032665D2B
HQNVNADKADGARAGVGAHRELLLGAERRKTDRNGAGDSFAGGSISPRLRQNKRQTATFILAGLSDRPRIRRWRDLGG